MHPEQLNIGYNIRPSQSLHMIVYIMSISFNAIHFEGIKIVVSIYFFNQIYIFIKKIIIYINSKNKENILFN